MAIDKAVDSGALDTLFENIGNAIREKDGTTALITPGNMPAKIRAIQKTAGAEPPEKYASLVEQAKALYDGSYDAILIQETVGQVNIGFLTNGFSVQSYQSYSTEFRALGWYLVRFDKVGTAEPSTQDWRENASQGGDYGSTIRFCGKKILYGTQQIYPRIYNTGDGLGAANGDGSYLGIFIGKPDNPGAVPGNKHIVILPAEIFFGEPETATEN